MPDPILAQDLVQRDTLMGIGQFLTPDEGDETHGFRLLDGFERDHDGGMHNAATGTVAVAWAFRGRHELPRSETGQTYDVMGFVPTGRVVDLRGVTLVQDDGDDVKFTRFVDWTSAMADIGIGFYKRPVIDDPTSAGLA